jgi:hypothetical protein
LLVVVVQVEQTIQELAAVVVVACLPEPSQLQLVHTL